MEIQETRKYVSTLTKQTLDVDIKMTTMCCFWQTETLKKKKKTKNFWTNVWQLSACQSL